MKFVGIDLHKQTISLCVVNQAREILIRRKFFCCHSGAIEQFFAKLGEFQAVVEATASYEWLWQLIEPLASRLVLANPSKLRVIAESAKKSDKLDAQVLAEFLALDMIPESYRPTRRQRSHRRLVRQRMYLVDCQKSTRCRIRAILSEYNADDPGLFTRKGLERLDALPLSEEDRFVVEGLLELWRSLGKQIHDTNQQLHIFAKKAPAGEAEAREVLKTIPRVGPVTVDVVVSEVGDIRRFRSAKQVCAYAGLVPGHRESAGKRKDLGITKQGSPRLRWALVEAAWRVVAHTNRWKTAYLRLKEKRGPKKAITAIARRLLCVMTAMLKSGQAYRMAA